MPGWAVVQAENKPLSDKWTVGLQSIRPHAPDAVMIVGSDNTTEPYTVLRICECVTEENPYWMPAGIFFLEKESGRLIYRAFRRCGAGRVLHRSLLDRYDWNVWKPDSDASDSAMDKRLMNEPAPLRYCGMILDVKTEENVWSFGHMARDGSYADCSLDMLRVVAPDVHALL